MSRTDAVSKDAFVKPGEVEIAGAYTKKFITSDRFFCKTYRPDGYEFFIFSEVGDYIYGKLLHGSRDNNEIHRTKSYQIEAYETRQHKKVSKYAGQLEEFFANRQLQKILTKNDHLVGKFIRIVYVGKLKSNWGGHASKVYRVFWDKGGLFKKQEVSVNG